MHNVPKKLIQFLIPLLDLWITAGTFILAYFFKKYAFPAEIRGLAVTPNYYAVLAMILVVWHFSIGYFGFVIPVDWKSLRSAIKNVVFGITVGFSAVTFFIYTFRMTGISRLMMYLFLLMNVILLAAEKYFLFLSIDKYLHYGKEHHNILIIGSRERAKEVIECISRSNLERYQILGCLDTDNSKFGKVVSHGVRVIGQLSELKTILLNRVVDEIIFAMPIRLVDRPCECFQLFESLGVSVRILPDWQIYNIGFKPIIALPRFDYLLNLPTLLLTTTTTRHSEYMCKVMIDYLLAALSLLVLTPVFATIAISIKIVAPGPVLFRQERIGLYGRKFFMLKFRTMSVDAEQRKKELNIENEADGPVFKIQDDPRIIPIVGKFLRKTSLDELPQLINVIKGEMSLVGPRPPIQEEVDQYDLWQRRRLSMKPGLTCLWQVSKNRNDMSFEEWMNMDLLYIDNWSLWQDMILIARTIKTVLTFSGR